MLKIDKVEMEKHFRDQWECYATVGNARLDVCPWSKVYRVLANVGNEKRVEYEGKSFKDASEAFEKAQ